MNAYFTVGLVFGPLFVRFLFYIFGNWRKIKLVYLTQGTLRVGHRFFVTRNVANEGIICDKVNFSSSALFSAVARFLI